MIHISCRRWLDDTWLTKEATGALDVDYKAQQQGHEHNAQTQKLVTFPA